MMGRNFDRYARVVGFLLIALLVMAGALCGGAVVPTASAEAAVSVEDVVAGLEARGSAGISLASGYYHTLLVSTNGTLYAWGRNNQGQLGDGTTTTRSTPFQVGTDSNWKQVDAGWYHSLGVRTDGTLWAWGDNQDGQLGTGGTADSRVPVQVGTDSNWVAVSTGHSHSLGIRTDGTLWAWGSNGRGQLGVGSTGSSRVPVQVGTFTDWTAVAAGDEHSLGIRTGGTLWGWGYNDDYELGLGYANAVNSPRQVGTATNWASVSAEWRYSMGIRADGTLWSWGWNTQAQLGLGDNITKMVPTRVGTETDWAGVFPGRVHTVGWQNDGSMWAWGANGDAELGVNDTTDRWSPVNVGTTSNWVAGSTGDCFSIGVRYDGTVWGWGRNGNSQLGLGDDSGQKYVPTKNSLVLGNFPPMVVTQAASEIMGNRATLNGYVLSLGSATTVQVSFEWGKDTLYGNTTPLQNRIGAGSFKSMINGLEPSRTYHFRAKVEGGGVSYGSDMSFKTTEAPPSGPKVLTADATMVGPTTATLNGKLDSLGTSPSVTVYFEYGTSKGSYSLQTENQTFSRTGAFYAEVKGLASGTTYYFRAVGSGADGTLRAGEFEFTTSGEPTFPPSVETGEANELMTDRARLNGSLKGLGTATNVTVLFEVGEAPGAYTMETAAAGRAAPGAYYADVTGLQPGRTYYYRAKSVGQGTGYGQEKSFTVPTVVPQVTEVTPPSAATGRKSSVVVTGDAFTDCIGLDLGPGITVDNFTVVSPTRITANITLAPNATVGQRDITVKTSDGSYVLEDGFTVSAPSSGVVPTWVWVVVVVVVVLGLGVGTFLIVRRKPPVPAQ